MKYIIFEGNGLVHPVLFSDHTTHSQVSIEGAKPVAAGFVWFDKVGWPHCYGKSDSLNLKSREETDATIINRFRNNASTAMFLVDFFEP